MFNWLGRIGEKTLQNFYGVFKSIQFDTRFVLTLVNPRSYNDATVSVFVKQVYFTAVELLPFYLLLSVLVGTVIVGVLVSTAINLNLQSQIGPMLVQLIIDEVAPFITVLLLALRSGAAINTEMAVMRVSGETNTLDYFNIDPFVYLYLPRILNGMISMLLLSGLFAIVALTSGYALMMSFLHMGMATYLKTVSDAVSIVDIVTLVLKSIAFGYVLTAIPVYRGNKTMLTYNAIPIAVLQGMVKLFTAIVLIEGLAFIRFV